MASIEVISGPLLNSGLRHFRYGTHQTINGRLELVHLPSYLILEWPGEGPLFQLELKKCRGLCSIISLSNLLKIMYLLASKNVEGSLSKHLCL